MYVIFSHGSESGPWGSKISSMAELARNEGFEAESIDYRGVDDPENRMTRLVSFCKNIKDPVVLVGSSMGGYVAAAASARLKPRGLFLLAPAFYLPAYRHQAPKPAKCPITIVHGWRDDVVPVENSFRYARRFNATLYVLDGDHRLRENIREISYLFEYFLVNVELQQGS